MEFELHIEDVVPASLSELISCTAKESISCTKPFCSVLFLDGILPLHPCWLTPYIFRTRFILRHASPFSPPPCPPAISLRLCSLHALYAYSWWYLSDYIHLNLLIWNNFRPTEVCKEFLYTFTQLPLILTSYITLVHLSKLRIGITP